MPEKKLDLGSSNITEEHRVDWISMLQERLERTIASLTQLRETSLPLLETGPRLDSYRRQEAYLVNAITEIESDLAARKAELIAFKQTSDSSGSAQQNVHPDQNLDSRLPPTPTNGGKIGW